MKVYVLVHEWQFDSGENGMEVEVFENLTKAQKRKTEIEENCKITWDEFFDTNYELEENENVATFYECGEYCYNHENIFVYERIVE